MKAFRNFLLMAFVALCGASYGDMSEFIIQSIVEDQVTFTNGCAFTVRPEDVAKLASWQQNHHIQFGSYRKPALFHSWFMEHKVYHVTVPLEMINISTAVEEKIVACISKPPTVPGPTILEILNVNLNTRIVTLSDQSNWQVSIEQFSILADWLEGHHIIVCREELDVPVDAISLFNVQRQRSVIIRGFTQAQSISAKKKGFDPWVDAVSQIVSTWKSLTTASNWQNIQTRCVAALLNDAEQCSDLDVSTRIAMAAALLDNVTSFADFKTRLDITGKAWGIIPWPPNS